MILKKQEKERNPNVAPVSSFANIILKDPNWTFLILVTQLKLCSYHSKEPFVHMNNDRSCIMETRETGREIVLT